MLNRSIPPELQEIDKIEFVSPSVHRIDGIAHLFHMSNVPNDTARLDLYFDAGTVRGDRTIASLVNGLLLSGSNLFTAVEIQEQIDALGGFYESGISHETAVISVYALKQHLLPILKIIVRALHELSFVEHEVGDLLNERKQKFKVNLEKVNFLAQREFQHLLFHDSVYGRVSEASDFDSVDRNILNEFFKLHYKNGLCKVVVVGDLMPEEINEIISLTKQWSKIEENVYEKSLQNKNVSAYVEKRGAIQTAIRVGRILFNKTHDDYLDFLVLNTILGDYFGSRLMSNIREEKGYTYGIGSMVAELHKTGYFMIATEVGTHVKDLAISEIRKEIEKLQKEPVNEEELALVKNYMLGQLLKSADGPYSMMDLFLGVEPYGLDLTFYNSAIASLRNITPSRIQELAKNYLNWEDMTIVAAG